MYITRDNLGTVVRDTRNAAGLTQSQLAAKAGCSQRLISELERGSGADVGKVLDVLEALRIQLEPKVVAPNNPAYEVISLARQLEKDLMAQAKPKPRLSELLS